MAEAGDRPRLRTDLELLVGEAQGERFLLVRDPDVLAVEAAPFGLGVLPILEALDGRRTIEEIRTDFARAGGLVPLDALLAFVDGLDRCCFLDNEHARAEVEGRAAFLEAPVREAAHAGAAYPAADAPAREFLAEMLDRADEAVPAPLERLIAPHIDLQLGAEVYAHAHRRLFAGGRPDVVIVLGVRHEYGTRRFTACRKDFETPRGTVRCDVALLDALAAEYGGDLYAEQRVHRGEHSVEFQALWLAHLWPADPPALVPLLVGSFGDLAADGRSPASDPEIEDFIGALQRVIAGDNRRVVVVASVDLAHLGPLYDQPEGLDADGEARMEREDRALLAHAEAGDAEAWFEAAGAGGNPRNVCGLAPVYVTLRLGEGPGTLLRYGQGRIHPESGSVVSFAALSYP